MPIMALDHPIEVPFFGNPDGRKCGPCVYRMMLKYFEPHHEYSFDQINDMCAATPGKNTWFFAIACAFADLGYDVHIITDYDFLLMNTDFLGYLTQRNGAELAQKSFASSDMKNLPTQIEKFVTYTQADNIKFDQRCWTKEDLIGALQQGYLACVWVNYFAIRNQDDFAGHFVLVYDYNGKDFILHDPGDKNPDTYMPAHSISPEHLIRAASIGSMGQTDNLILIKPKNKV